MHKYCQSNCPRKTPPFFNIPCLFHPTFPEEWSCNNPCCSCNGECQSSYAIYTVSPFTPTANPTFVPYVLATGNGPEITISSDGTTITLAPGCVYNVSLSINATTDGNLTMTPFINGPASPENIMTVYAPSNSDAAVPLYISHSFLIAVTGAPVTLRIQLGTTSAANPTAITGALSIVTVAEA